MPSSIHPAIAGQIAGITTNAEYGLKPANDQPTREEMLEKLKADAIALLQSVRSTSSEAEQARK